MRSFLRELARGSTLVAALVAMGVLLWQRREFSLASSAQQQRSDSTLRVVADVVRQRDSLPAAGGTLASGLLIDVNGDSLQLRRLLVGRKYVYLHRADCVACQLLEPLMAAVKQSVRDSIIEIAYSDVRQQPKPEGISTYTWVRGSSGNERRLALGVPTLFVVDENGRIVSVAHSSLERVRDVLDLNRVIKASAIDSAIRVAESSRILERSGNRR